MNKYMISFCGVHGSGKTTLEVKLAKEYNFFIPPKRNLFPLRMINHKGLLAYLKNYHDQLNTNARTDRYLITSRFGILDILIYSEALFSANRINHKERLEIIRKCKELITFWPLPEYLVNLTADLDILYKRLINRDSEYDNGIVRDRKKLNHVRNAYQNNIVMEDFSNQLIEKIVIRYKKLGGIVTLDSSEMLPSQLFETIRNKYDLDKSNNEKHKQFIYFT